MSGTFSSSSNYASAGLKSGDRNAWVTSAHLENLGGEGEALALLVRLVAGKATAWTNPSIQANTEDAFESQDYLFLTPMLIRRVGISAAAAIMRCATGHALKPLSTGWEGTPIRIGKGCRRGAPEGPYVCKVVVDDAIAARMLTHMAYAGDVRLVSKSATEATATIRMLRDALRISRSVVQEDKLGFRTNPPAEHG